MPHFLFKLLVPLSLTNTVTMFAHKLLPLNTVNSTAATTLHSITLQQHSSYVNVPEYFMLDHFIMCKIRLYIFCSRTTSGFVKNKMQIGNLFQKFARRLIYKISPLRAVHSDLDNH